MKFLVLDGNSIFSRAFYGIKNLSTKNGQFTNGIYGFLSTLQKLLVEVCPDRVAIAFDLPLPTFRHKLYNGYKSNRSKMPEEMASQLPILKNILCFMGYKIVSLEGFEADDILGRFSDFCETNNYECILATGDRDLLQLISNKVLVRITSTKFGKSESTLYDIEKVKLEYGVNPKNLVDIKSLQGDTSDNIPGVKGLGKKIAGDLISKFENIDYIYKNIDTIDIKPKIKEKLIIGKELAYLSYNLGKIEKNIPLKIEEKDYIIGKQDDLKLREIFLELEFFSLIEKMKLNELNKKIENVLIEELSSADNFLNINNFSFKLNIINNKIKNLFLFDGKKIYILDYENKNFQNIFKMIFNNLDCKEKITYNLKIFQKYTDSLNIEVNENYFDVMLASYILDPSEKIYDIFKLSNIYKINEPNIISQNNDLLSEETVNLAKEVYIIYKIKDILEKNLKDNNQYELLKNIEQPISKVLASMESIGFLVDKTELQNYKKNLEIDLNKIETSIYELSGEVFNINSTKQLGNILFEKLELPKGKKGKNGYSTDAQILEKLKGTNKIIDEILKYRTISKLKSTYCDGMIKLISYDGRIHSSFNQTETRTGRISSSEPNLQNIPVRTKRGRLIRKFFKASENNMLISADYSQIELRVLAHIAQDSNMIVAFKNNKDIHNITASEIFNVTINDVNSDMRFKAKAVNFGILYGMSAFSLSQDLNISIDKAKIYIERYLNHYKDVEQYMENVIKKAKIDGYVETIFKRRRYLPELKSSNYNLRSFGERVARNMPIQGISADIIKIAMINVFEKLKDKKSKLILQIHDELIIESPKEEVDEIKNILKYEMENAVLLDIPLNVNVSIGKTWYDTKI